MTLPRALHALTNATLVDGRVVDVLLDGATVSEVRPAQATPHDAWARHDHVDAAATADSDSAAASASAAVSAAAAAAAAATLDLTGFLLLTAPAEPHAHLDKALSWPAIRPPMGDLRLAISSWRAYAATMTVDDVADRARRQALEMLAQGTTAIRTHVDVLQGDLPLRGVEALVRVRDELAGLLDLELVALAGPDVPDAHIHSALEAGVDLVGGSPHLADDPSGDLHRLLRIAAEHGVGVDLHTDESLAGAVTLGEFAAAVADWDVNVSAGHCVRLGSMPAIDRDRLIEAAKASRIGVIANPITNLYLQGWGDDVSTPRGITAARQLIDAGARFAAGADNVRDPFNPLGRSDALETVMLLVTAAHLTLDEAFAAISGGAREVMGLPLAGAVVGARAEFLAIRAADLAEAVATAPADRHVIHGGALVATSRVEREIAQPLSESLRQRATETGGRRQVVT